MWLFVIGLIALGLKISGHTFVAALDWPWVLWPFPLTVVWWMLADALGFTQREQIKKIERRKEDRRKKLLDNLKIKDRRRGEDRRRSDQSVQESRLEGPSTIISWHEAIKKK